MQRIVGLSFLVSIGIAVCLLYAIYNRASSRDISHADATGESTSVHSGTMLVNASEPVAEAKPSFGVTIRKPDGPPRVELAGQDPLGRSGSVACSTCHSVRPPNFANTTAATLNEFHQGLQFQHGNLTCYACHNPDDADSLRLADQTSVAYSDVMTLCSQCHGLQATAMAHGAHGGMNGFWDLSRGPQTKNNCIDCHDPHQPSFPKMIVGFKPRDRFLEPQETAASHD